MIIAYYAKNNRILLILEQPDHTRYIMTSYKQETQ